MVIIHVSKSWDDPPSTSQKTNVINVKPENHPFEEENHLNQNHHVGKYAIHGSLQSGPHTNYNWVYNSYNWGYKNS